MAAEPTGETPALAAEYHSPSAGTSESNGQDKEKGLNEVEPAEPGAHVELKMEEAGGEASEEKPVEAADKAPSEAEAHDGTVTVSQEKTAAPEEPETKPEPEQSPGEGNSEPANDSTMKEAKDEPGEDSRCSEADCEKSKAVGEDGEKPSSGGGELDDKRRPSVEISSSDGEPLSRMDSEDSISSTLMEMESTVSSGRSTPAMMNGQISTSSSVAKTVAYSCCWDLCPQCFNSSPDLAEHIRGIHVDGQRGGVFLCLWKGCKVYNTPSTSQSWLQRHMLTHSGDKPFKCVVGGCNASFASQGGLARHVPSHFSQQSSSKMSSQAKLKEESPSKAGLNKRKKLKNKRRCSLHNQSFTKIYFAETEQKTGRGNDPSKQLSLFFLSLLLMHVNSVNSSCFKKSSLWCIHGHTYTLIIDRHVARKLEQKHKITAKAIMFLLYYCKCKPSSLVIFLTWPRFLMTLQSKLHLLKTKQTLRI
ncbi:zinc finger protein AEBP2 isoform X1 [Pleuronectes platessa]|uniref:zinc finger protein AEBP2 isoform X1 n=1 Tax=Pleuronectes platessa TaxID=8262 RepID=UPI00232A4BD9|nr:zinc finger protein AEBP2 isoform X1 [Pleuronectes platessa]